MIGNMKTAKTMRKMTILSNINAIQRLNTTNTMYMYFLDLIMALQYGIQSATYI